MPSQFEVNERYYSPVDTESWVDKVARECYVFGAGTVLGVKEGARQAMADKTGTALKLGGSAGLGAGMAYLAEVGGVGRVTAKLCGLGFGVAMVSDLLSPGRWESVKKTAVDTWASDQNTQRNIERTKVDLGRVAFDTAAMTASGYLGAKAGQAMRPKVTFDEHGIANFTEKGFLPPGEYRVDWAAFEKRFGTNPHRMQMLERLKLPLGELKSAGVKEVYIGGSLVTAKPHPGDFDGGYLSKEVDVKKMWTMELPPPHMQSEVYGGSLFPDGVSLSRSKYFGIKDFLSLNRRLNRPVGMIVLDVQNSPEIQIPVRQSFARGLGGRVAAAG